MARPNIDQVMEVMKVNVQKVRQLMVSAIEKIKQKDWSEIIKVRTIQIANRLRLIQAFCARSQLAYNSLTCRYLATTCCTSGRTKSQTESLRCVFALIIVSTAGSPLKTLRSFLLIW